jgi:hypothetical protein
MIGKDHEFKSEDENSQSKCGKTIFACCKIEPECYMFLLFLQSVFDSTTLIIGRVSIKTFIIFLKQVINKSGALPCFWQIRFYYSKIDNIATSFRKYGLFKIFYV